VKGKVEETKTQEHYVEGCSGSPVLEYSDEDGKHYHCPVCGYWRVEK
jgi:hypothetical protein